MAKQTNGLLGGYAGKIGPVVGYLWKGKWCVRTIPQQVRNPRTEAQMEHRTIFAEGVRLAGKMRWAVNIGFKALSDAMGMTPQNLFVSANQQAFSMVDGRFEVDYARLSVADGPVAPVAIEEWNVDAGNVLTVSFEKNPLRLSCSAHDNVYVWVWCPEAGEGYLTNPVYRRMKGLSTLLPDFFEGKEVHVYAFVQDDRGSCSATAYGGPNGLDDGALEESDETLADDMQAPHAEEDHHEAAETEPRSEAPSGFV